MSGSAPAATAVEAVLGADLASKIAKARVFMVGCGGIGCELLKDLVGAGFRNIEIIDMDTIDVSNLNRQFLFRKHHVGQPKSEIAKQSALDICPEASITSYMDNVKATRFGPEFLKKFDVVVNALDNLDARRHVNRLCLAAKIPLVESGSAGYLGQVQTIFGGETECFECQAKVAPKQYPYCTIHATPSEPVHNVIWAKEYLFRILFGPPVEDDDEDDTAVQARQQKLPEELEKQQQAEAAESYGRLQFHRAFNESIYRLLQLEALWEKRKKPQQLDFQQVVASSEEQEQEQELLQDQQKLSISATAQLFVDACNRLQQRKEEIGSLGFDKDDDDALDFVTAAANLRSHCYGMEILSRFDIKQKAGNIIPAIATTNAIVAGLIVVEAIKIIAGKRDECRFTYVNKEPNRAGRLLLPLRLEGPSASCFVCSSKFVNVEVTDACTLGDLKTGLFEGVLKLSVPSVLHGERCLYEPAVEGEEDEYAGQLDKKLSEFGMTTGSVLEVMDDLSQLTVSLSLKFVDRITKMDEETKKETELTWRVATADEPEPTIESAEPEQKRAKTDNEVL